MSFGKTQLLHLEEEVPSPAEAPKAAMHRSVTYVHRQRPGPGGWGIQARSHPTGLQHIPAAAIG